MKCLFLISLISSVGAFAQTPPAAPTPADVKPDTVIARMGAKTYTSADIKALTSKLPAELQKAFAENPKSAMQSLVMMEYLSNEADKTKLSETTPYKEQLALMRVQLLSQAMVQQHASTIQVTDAEVRKSFNSDPKRFDQAKISVIMIGFADPKVPGAKVDLPNESDAKAKAADLAVQARQGADFSDLAKKYSQDKSGPEGGAFGKVRRSDNIPEEVRNAIFALKPGGISDPVKLGPGFYVIKLDEMIPAKFEDVRDQLSTSMKNEAQQKWLQSLQKQFEVTIEKPEFFGAPKSATPLAGPAPAPAGGR